MNGARELAFIENDDVAPDYKTDMGSNPGSGTSMLCDLRRVIPSL